MKQRSTKGPPARPGNGAGARSAANHVASAAAEGDDARFLASYDVNAFERPSVAVDVALVTAAAGELFTLLVRRQAPPQAGRWALPGTFVGMGEALEAAAARALATKAALAGVFVEQLYTFGAPGRDPRTRVISVAHYALVDRERFVEAAAAAGVEAVAMFKLQVPWVGEAGGPARVVDASGCGHALAFDHADILGAAIKRLRGKLNYAPVGFELLGDAFTLLELQRVHEAVLGRPLNKDSFRRRMLASGLLEPTGQSETNVGHRPALLYRFGGGVAA
ncbi:MAG: NUDIX domain-containing protein [Polyangiaceae bacterium]|jgi:8-oxo-dGTP diphosphatase|nr:NUDIX domain-containing protein [Polyangiaceae bacterium]